MAARTVPISRGIEGAKNGIFQCAVEIIDAIPAIRATSPIRFVIAVIIPAPNADGVW